MSKSVFVEEEMTFDLRLSNPTWGKHKYPRQAGTFMFSGGSGIRTHETLSSRRLAICCHTTRRYLQPENYNIGSFKRSLLFELPIMSKYLRTSLESYSHTLLYEAYLGLKPSVVRVSK